MDRAAHESRVLHGEGVVEPETLAELVHVLRLDVHRHEQQHGITAEPNHAEDRSERQQHDERRLHQPGENVTSHCAYGRLCPRIVAMRERRVHHALLTVVLSVASVSAAAAWAASPDEIVTEVR